MDSLPAPPAPDTRRPTVLIVDDEPALLDAMALVLRKEPYRVITASSAAHALAILRDNPVEVVVTDERMPGMSGSKFLSIVRAEHPSTVRVMLTGEGDLATASRVVHESEPYRLLFKPAEPRELKAVLLGAVRMQTLRRGDGARPAVPGAAAAKAAASTGRIRQA
jgi:two-component system probable response regulator PhcQ